MTDTKLEDEAGRLAALHRYDVLDTPNESSFDRITGLVKVVLNVPMVMVSLIDERRQWFKSCVGLETRETARDISFCKYTIQTREPMNISDALLDSRFAENPLVTGAPFIRSYLGVPLATPDGYNLGSLCAIDTRPRVFDAGQVAVLKSFADLVMDEMELRRIAQVDDLTGALTRRGFALEAERAISRFVRRQRQSALLIVDIDHFKRINDTYGHPAGDVVLRYVGRVLAGQLRVDDAFGRLGGEEFGILLADADLDAATQIAERLRQTIENAEIGLEQPIHITASFGIAAVGPESLSVDQWMAVADQGLYAAKRSGRNRCCVVEPVTVPGLG